MYLYVKYSFLDNVVSDACAQEYPPLNYDFLDSSADLVHRVRVSLSLSSKCWSIPLKLCSGLGLLCFLNKQKVYFVYLSDKEQQ